MRWRWWLLGAVGVGLTLLGGLWLAQGIGLVQIDPVACVGECEPVEAPSLTWSLLGGILVAVGVGGIWWAGRRLSPAITRSGASPRPSR